MAVNKTVGVDTDVVLDFTYDGAPLGYVTWTKDGDPLPSSSRFSVGMDGACNLKFRGDMPFRPRLLNSVNSRQKMRRIQSF